MAQNNSIRRASLISPKLESSPSSDLVLLKDTRAESFLLPLPTSLLQTHVTKKVSSPTFFRGIKPLYEGEIVTLDAVHVDRNSDTMIKIIGYMSETRRNGTAGYLTAGLLTPLLDGNTRQILWITSGDEEIVETISDDEYNFCLRTKWFDLVTGKNKFLFLGVFVMICLGEPQSMRKLNTKKNYCCSCDQLINSSESSTGQYCRRSECSICDDCFVRTDFVVYESIFGYCTRCASTYRHRAYYCLKERYKYEITRPTSENYSSFQQ